MNKPLRIAQVGCGARGQEHLISIVNSSDVELIGLCDVDAGKLREAAGRFGVEQTFSDMGAMIRELQPELVNIVTPPNLRTRVVEPAIEAGAKAILIEKPMALTPSEAQRLEELGRDRFIAVNTQYRWKPHWINLWPRLRDGELGEITFVRASTRDNILDQGPHVLDLAFSVAREAGLGAPAWTFASASGLTSDGATPIPADTLATFGLTNSEARIVFHAGPSAPGTNDPDLYYNIQVEVLGTRGRFHATLTRGWMLQSERGTTRGETAWNGDDLKAQPAMLRDLRDAVHTDSWRDFPTNVANAKKVSDAMFACYASAVERRRVYLDEPLNDHVIEGLRALG